MSRLLTISNEAINVNASRMFGAEMLAMVEKIRAAIDSRAPDPAHFEQLSAIITKHTGIKVKTKLHVEDFINAYASLYTFYGHSGVSYDGEWSRSKYDWNDIKPLGDVIHTFEINLDTGLIKGTMTELFEFQLGLYSGLWTNRAALTNEEITAIIMHEVGHMFITFMGLGDYVYLNYMLSEGVDVLLGKRPNQYKLTMLTLDTLQKTVTDPELRKKLIENPNEENMRLAIMSTYGRAPRHYLTGSAQAKNSIKRHEQFADFYASRQGFSRALVTGLDKMWKGEAGSQQRGKAAFVYMEIAKAIGFIGAAGLTVAAFAFPPAILAALPLMVACVGMSNPDFHESYDSPTERFTKIRKELLGQLKFAKDAGLKESINQDLIVVDNLLAGYNQKRTLWELIETQFGEDRRQFQLRRQEETLENLMNNDLFLQAYRISTTLKKG